MVHHRAAGLHVEAHSGRDEGVHEGQVRELGETQAREMTSRLAHPREI